MTTRSRIASLPARLSRTSRKPAARLRSTLLERLEERLAPAAYVLGTLADNISARLSLREAIVFANQTAEADTITIPSSPYAGLVFDPDTFSFVSNDLIRLNGTQLPSITSAITIVGEDPPPETATSSRFTISGQGLSRVFFVAGTGSLTLENLVVANGAVPDFGGAIFNGGTLALDGVTVSGSSAVLGGGGIYSSGNLSVSNSSLVGNSAALWGGGILVGNGSASIEHSTISGNTVKGLNSDANSPSATPDQGGIAKGGGLAITGGSAVVSFSTFHANLAQGGAGAAGIAGSQGSSDPNPNPLQGKNGAHGGNGGGGATGAAGGEARGGAISVEAGSLSIVNSTLVDNTARGGRGGIGGAGGNGGNGQPGSAFINSGGGFDYADGGSNGGNGGNGGVGGNGGAGGFAAGGAIYVGASVTSLSMTSSTIANNEAVGGRSGGSGTGGDGGDGGKGGNIFGSVTGQWGRGGDGGDGRNGGVTGAAGGADGGGIHIDGSTTAAFITASTIAFNHVQKGEAAASPAVPDSGFITPPSGGVIIPSAIGFGGSKGLKGANGTNGTGSPVDGLPGQAGSEGSPNAISAGGIGHLGSDTYNVTLKNTIVAGNTRNHSDEGAVNTLPINIGGVFTTPANSLSNMIGGGNAGGLQNTSGNKILVADPGLLPLGNYGGVFQTVAIKSASPALDAGDNEYAPSLFDQRGEGFKRVSGDQMDIGAFEAQQSYVVTTLHDENDGSTEASAGQGTSLREALLLANSKGGNPTIRFAPGLTGTIKLTLGNLLIGRSMVLEGPGAELLSIDAQDASRVMLVTNQAFGSHQVEVRGVSLVNGNSDFGAGIYSIVSKLTLDSVVMSNNHATEQGGAIYHAGALSINTSTLSHNSAKHGGAVSSDLLDHLTILNSTLSYNHATQTGGAIYVDQGNLRISNTTIAANAADFRGGGVYAVGRSGVSYANLTHVTLAINQAPVGPGLYGEGILGRYQITIANSIIADAIKSQGSINPEPAMTILGASFDGNAVMLGPLQDNGGPTETMALLPGSAAYDTGMRQWSLDPNGQLLVADQRGLTRVRGANVDLGAYEVQPAILSDDLLPAAAWGLPYASHTFTAAQEGQQASWGPLTFAITAGALPAGLSLSSEGVLSGTPMPSQAGTFTFTVSAMNRGGFGSREYTLTIDPPPPIRLETVSLSRGTLGIPFSQAFIVAQQGYQPAWGPFAYSITDGALPAGLSLSAAGVLSGTPTAVGTFTFMVEAGNLSGSDRRECTITIVSPPSPIVDTLDDNFDQDFSPGQFSLREAIAIVQYGGIEEPVTFAAGLAGTIDLSQGKLSILGDVEIVGPGASSLTIDAKGRSQVFDIIDGDLSSAREVRISGLTITGAGGTAITNSEDLTLNHVVVTDNAGSGIHNEFGLLLVVDSTISSNTNSGIVNRFGVATVKSSTISGNAAGMGGGINNGDSGILTVVNSTIFGNSATRGGGIFSEGYGFVEVGNLNPPAEVTLTNVTIAGNTATQGAGIFNHWMSGLTLANSIVADNFGPQVANDAEGATQFGQNWAATLGLLGGNLVEGGLEGFTGVISGDPKLGVLRDNGGPTRTMALLAGSPAANAGDASVLTDGVEFDQRGNSFHRIVSGRVDLGAYEADTRPTISAHTAAIEVDEGSSVFNFGTFGDFDGNETVSITASIGTVTQDDATGGWNWSYLATDDAEIRVTITAADDLGQKETTSFTVSINNVDPFVASRLAATTEGAPIAPINLLTGATDAGSRDTLSAQPASGTTAQGGVFTIAANGSFTYSPNGAFEHLAAGQLATDVISFTVFDDDGGITQALVTVTITGENDAPSARPDFNSTTENERITTNVVANDTDPDAGDVLSLASEVLWVITSENHYPLLPKTSLATVSGNSIEFDPGTDFDTLPVGQTAMVSISYKVQDNRSPALASNGMLTITVVGTFDAGTARDDFYTVAEDGTLVVAARGVLENDLDPDFDGPKLESYGEAAHGEVRMGLDGSFTYVPARNYNGPDSFTYTVDGSTATVYLTVTPVADFDYGDAPATYGVAQHAEGSASTGPLLGVRDFEDGNQTNSNAFGDDSAGVDDEDGVTFNSLLVSRHQTTITVHASAAGVLDAWIDFNRNGTFDRNEKIASGFQVSAGANSLVVAVPEVMSSGETFARFRISTAGSALPTGVAADGEVEDYRVSIAAPAAKSAQLIDDPENPGTEQLDVLVVNGSDSADVITVRVTSPGVVSVFVTPNWPAVGTYSLASIGRIVMFGRGGADVIRIDSAIQKPAMLYGDAGNDAISGGSGPGQFFGGEGIDWLNGNAGNDVFYGSTGNDIISGGGGFDRIVELAGSAKVTATAITVGASTDMYSGIEQIELFGTEGNETFTLSSVTAGILLDAGAGNDTLVYSSSGNFVVTDHVLTRTAGSTVQAFSVSTIESLQLTGGTDANRIDISGWTKAAILNGGGNTDTVVAAGDIDFTLSDTKLVRTGLQAITLSAIENARLTGGASDNTFTVSGWTRAATLDGGGGTDTLVVTDNAATTTLTNTSLARTGRSTISHSSFEAASLTGGAAANTIHGAKFRGQLRIDGAGGNDTLTGGAGASLLLGGLGNDVLRSGAGRSILIGGGGVDRLTGGVDEDLLIDGSTIHDADAASLALLLNEWSSAGSYGDRVLHLTGTSGGLNGAVHLGGTNVLHDGQTDVLAGMAALDWFFAKVSNPAADLISDFDSASGEQLGS